MKPILAPGQLAMHALRGAILSCAMFGSTIAGYAMVGSAAASAHELDDHSFHRHESQHRDVPRDHPDARHHDTRHPDSRHPDSRRPNNRQQDYPRPAPGYWSGVFNAGITFGGEKMAEVLTEDYHHHVEREDIKAGELFLFGGGLAYTQDSLQLQGTLGYHVDGVFGHNGDASFTRWPLEMLAFLRTPQWRVGGGITHHIDPELDIDIDFQQNKRVNFKNATGVVLQADYLLSPQLSIGLRHTAIDYEPDGSSDVKIEGGNTGLMLSFIF